MCVLMYTSSGPTSSTSVSSGKYISNRGREGRGERISPRNAALVVRSKKSRKLYSGALKPKKKTVNAKSTASAKRVYIAAKKGTTNKKHRRKEK